LTTFYHSGFVQKAVAPLKRRVIALTLSLNKEALYQIVSLPRDLRIGVVLGPTDPAPTIVKSLEYYRDQPAGSIPYAIISDIAAVKRLRAKADSIAYTIPCQDQVIPFLKQGERAILLRFGPAEDDVRKVQALLGSSLSRNPARLAEAERVQKGISGSIRSRAAQKRQPFGRPFNGPKV